MISKYQVLVLAILLSCGFGFAFASDSVVQINVEGGATCNELSTNSILQAKDNTVTVNGPDSVIGGNNQTFQYTTTSSNGISNNTISLWSISAPASGKKPVNFIIIKKAGNAGATAFYYGNSGATTDTSIVLPAAIQTVTFCYGLATIPVPTTITSCGTICNSLAAAGIQSRIVTQFDEPANNSQNWQVTSCACGTYTECNPSLLAGTPGSCTHSNAEGGGLLFLPISVELARDPGTYFCLVLNGARKCYAK
jgi:hypothetical protein